MNFHQLFLLLRYAKDFGHSHIKKAGLSDTEHMICIFLTGHSGASQDDVAEALKFEKATVARALLSLEKKNLVKRTVNLDNRRKYNLFLTDLGKENISKVANIYDIWFQKISECLNQQEQNQFCEYCKRLLSEAQKNYTESEDNK